MNKSISINLGGLSFFIEEDAFLKLQKYLNDVKTSLNNEGDDADEIIKDVEMRIAELFKEWLGNFRQVIDVKDVDKMIEIMGTPEQYQSDEQEDNEENSAAKSAFDGSRRFYQRQLFRDPNDKILGGVCSGVSHFFGIESTWGRLTLFLLWALFAWLFDGVAPFLVVAYIICWIIMPIASTTSDKLKMKGKPVNFSSIKDYVSKEDISEYSGKAKKNIAKASNGLEEIFKIVLRIVLILIGVILIITGISLFIGYFATAFAFSIAGNNLLYFKLYFDTSWQFYAMIILSAISVFFIALGFIYLGVRIIANKSVMKVNTTTLIGIFAVWLIATLALIVMTVALITSQFSSTIETKNKYILNTQTDTLNVKMNDWNDLNSSFSSKFIHIDDFKFSKDSLYSKINKDLRIDKSPDNQYYLALKSTSSGSDDENAQKNVEKINYIYQLHGNQLDLNSYLSLSKSEGYKKQNIELTLLVPDGKYVRADNIFKVYHQQSNNSYDDYYNSNALYKLENDSLKCLTCNGEVSYRNEADNVSIGKDGVKIKSGKDNVNINIGKDGIKIKSGKDSVVVDYEH
ncbi:MAG: PspC domain-containing protein [Flavobacteriaceae bacterium]|jgi:phage shock protein PspC (stress-responsive transcriptional regulator)|nr:PspC domain-containing protein [Flavobacteriaceae bacterium]